MHLRKETLYWIRDSRKDSIYPSYLHPSTNYHVCYCLLLEMQCIRDFLRILSLSCLERLLLTWKTYSWNDSRFWLWMKLDFQTILTLNITLSMNFFLRKFPRWSWFDHLFCFSLLLVLSHWNFAFSHFGNYCWSFLVLFFHISSNDLQDQGLERSRFLAFLPS